MKGTAPPALKCTTTVQVTRKTRSLLAVLAKTGTGLPDHVADELPWQLRTGRVEAGQVVALGLVMLDNLAWHLRSKTRKHAVGAARTIAADFATMLQELS